MGNYASYMQFLRSSLLSEVAECLNFDNDDALLVIRQSQEGASDVAALEVEPISERVLGTVANVAHTFVTVAKFTLTDVY